jgi:hypothetical protein
MHPAYITNKTKLAPTHPTSGYFLKDGQNKSKNVALDDSGISA